jgi:phosphoglycerate-specific signal transduction histidine kinase
MNREELQQYITDAVTASAAEVLTSQLEPLRDQMAALSGIPAVSPRARDAELQAAMRQHRDHLQRIDAEREKSAT